VANAPVADQHRLLEVQALDTQLAQLAHKRANLPQQEKVAEVESRIADLSGALVASRTQAADLSRELTKAETDVEQVVTRTQRNQERLDSGAVSAKDATALMSEIESLTNRRGVLEEIQLDIMERLDAHNDALAKLEDANSGMQEELAKAQSERDAEFAAIDAQAKLVAAERAQSAQGIDAALLATYDKLRGQLGGVGAAALVGNRCGGCRLELNPNDLADIKAAPQERVVRCEECGRILVRTNADPA